MVCEVGLYSGLLVLGREISELFGQIKDEGGGAREERERTAGMG